MAAPAPSEEPKPTAEQGAIIDICNDGSLIKEIITPGTGDSPSTGYKVKCHYTGTLLDGSKFDSSRDRGTPFEFTIGEGVITGWSEGVATMKKGERAMFTIVADKAYGAHGSPPKIPGGATLKFDIELLSFSPPPPNDVSLAKDLGVILTKVNPGEGWKKPAEFSKVTADLTVGLDETGVTVVEKHRIDFVLGHGEVLKGVEEGVLAMNKGETSVLRLEPKYAYGATGSSELGVPPAAVVNATVSLVNFENEKAPHELDSDAEKIGAINLRREAGNDFFKNKDYDRAVKRYKTALGVVPDYELKDASAEVRAALRPCHLNQAACFLKLGRASAANEACGKVLAEEPASIKALYRKGCALLDMGEYQDAKKTLKKCLATDPGNKGAILSLKKVDAKIAADAKKAKAMFGGMFDRMAAADAQKSANKSKEPE